MVEALHMMGLNDHQPSGWRLSRPSLVDGSQVRPGTLPTQVAAWSVRTGYDEWLLQDVEVRATAKAVEQGLAVGAAVSANGAGETKGYNR